MPEYCSTGDVIKRLTEIGRYYVADRNDDGRVSGTESSWNISEPIAWAGAQIDGALVDSNVTIVQARASANDWLKQLCVDLAVWRCYTQGGREAPASVAFDFQNAWAQLQRLAGGGLIPGYPYPNPVNAITRSKTAKVSNWSTTCGCGIIRR